MGPSSTKITWSLISFSVLFSLSLIYLTSHNDQGLQPLPAPEYAYDDGQEETEEEIAFERAMDEARQAYPVVNPEDLNEAERHSYEQKMRQLRNSGFNFSSLVKDTTRLSVKARRSSLISYGKGAISGKWQTRLPIPLPNTKNNNIGNGYRVVGSAYDPMKDQLYAVSTPGHLYKVDKTGELQWTLLDHKRNYNKIFFAFNLPDSTFRMVKNEQPDALIGHLSYSDDEGQTWTPSNGVLLQNNWADNGFKAVINDSIKLFALGDHNNSANVKTKYVFISHDLGLNFVESALNFKSSDHTIQLVKTYHSEQAYLFVRHKASGIVKLYKYNNDLSDFELLHTLEGTFSDWKRAVGTFSGGKVHFYISETGKILHYSHDEGATWTTTTIEGTGAIKNIHPNQPNTVFKGFIDVYVSKDFGVTYESFKHQLGWDLRHLEFHKKSNGKYFTFMGKDFGCFISDVPEDTTFYQPLNSGSPIALHYDAASNERFNTIHMANQDKGTSAYLDTGRVVNTKGVAGTDVLRVTYAKGGESVWIWYYYGKIEHRFNFASPDFIDEKAGKGSGLGRWQSRNLVASPDSTEDAVYATMGSSLQKFTYANGVVTKTAHAYDFGKEVSGFGYSNVDTDRWYVSTKDGDFFYSTDGGASFTLSEYTGPTPAAGGGYNKNKHVIHTSKADPDIVYYAGNSRRFLISRDGGVTFTDHITGFEVDRVRDFDITNDDKYIFAACASGGPWLFSVDDDQWYKMDGADVPRVDFTDIDYISSKNIARFATYGSGIVDFIIDTPLPTRPAVVTSLHLAQESTVKLFPNPAFNNISITGVQKGAPLEIYNGNGALMMNVRYTPELDISILPPGQYLLRINDASAHRFIKN